jgi:hypothetical protein
MVSVVTSNEFDHVRISWELPFYDGGSPLLDYRIMVQTKLGLLIEQQTYCDGTDSEIKANIFCLIPMPILRQDPYNLELGDIVIAQAEARNVIGYSVESTLNTGFAEMRTEPSAPVTNVLRIDPGTTDT